jgi:predicted permease
MAVVGRVVDAAHPNPGDSRTIWGATVPPVAAGRANAEFRTVFVILSGAVGLVLLLACVNIANMLLARAAGRERELVIRAALGAGRGRLTRHLVVESLLLGVVGGAVGLGFAAWGIDLLRTIVPRTTGGRGVLYFDPSTLQLDAVVVLFAAAIALLTGVLIGLIPAWRFSRPESSAALREGAGTVQGLGSLRRPTLRGGLVMTEVALAVVLLAGAGLMIRTLANLAAVDPGFEPDGVLSLRYRLPPTDARSSDPAFHHAVLERLTALPGVRAGALNACPPLSGCYDYNSLSRIDGEPRIADDDQPMVRTQFVSEGFFAALGVPLLAGRDFAPADRRGSEPVIIINRAAAERFFKGGSPLGRGMAVSNGLTGPDSLARIIGVVGNVHYESLQERPTAEVYVSLRQMPTEAPAVYLRTAGDPLTLMPVVRAALHEIAPDAPIHQVVTLSQLVAASATSERLVAWSLVGFAVLALALAALGVYGVVAFSVGQRRREVAVRMALGADPGRVLRQILGEGLTLVVGGALVGLVAALVTGSALSKLLYGVAPRDPRTLVMILALLLAIATLATLLPARRAAAADPMTALRAD